MDEQASRPGASSLESEGHGGASLALLQTVVAGFVDNPESPESFLLLLREIERLIGAKCSAIFLIKDSRAEALPLVCTDAGERDCFVDLLRERMPPSTLSGSDSIQTFTDPAHPDTHIILLQLVASDGVKKGLLLVKRRFTLPLSLAETALLNSLGRHLAAIICSAQRAQSKRRIALYEERAVIARELHDSLAQSLTYLKIQTSRLQSLLHLSKENKALKYEDADAVLQELRTNLNLAYRQLRELITTFRLTMNGRTLGQALMDSVEEFENRSSVAFTLDNRVPDGQLSVDEEMHILQIVRECICNVVRHAQAKHADVSLYKDGFGVVRITVDDDGVGMDEPRSPDQHHGLVIMQQRAHSLGGEMRVLRSPDGGTRIRVSLPSRRENTKSGQPIPSADQAQPQS
jgi:two-component system nitrate/nitrite sensor histidine kinase NarX